jgi:PAS domain S-box-containing protein
VNQEKLPFAGDTAEELPALIERLLETSQRIEELTAGEVDTVSDRDGRTFLLPSAQDQVRYREAAKQTAILNALPAHIALLDIQGIIISVNEAWRQFASANVLQGPGYGVGLNYLEICDRARGVDSSEAHQVAKGIRSVLEGAKDFSIEYPCHSPTERRWFLLMVTPLADDHSNGAVVMHLNITQRKRAEQALDELSQRTQRRERMLSMVLSSISDFTYVFNREGRFLFANQPLLNLWGIALEAAVGKNFIELGYAVELAERMQRQVREVFETKKVIKDETLYISPTGVHGYYEYIFSPAVAADGTVDFVVGSTRDVTERKQAAALVAESRQRLALATESAHIGIWDWEVVANKMIWDTQMYELYGIREQEFSGAYDAWQKGLHPEDQGRAEAEIASALAGDKDFHSEFRVVWPSGEVRDIEAYGVVRRAIDGSPSNMIGVNWDITMRKRGVNALRESEERYRDIFENASDLIQTVATDGTLLYVNHAWRAALGYKDEDLAGLNFLQLVHPDQRAKTEQWFQQAIAGAALPLVESQFISKSQKGILVEGSVNAKVVNGQVVSLRCIFRDVTEKKALEAQFLRAQRLEGIGTLASGVAHDLNNMLAPILMSAPMLRWGLKPEQFEATLNTIESCAQRGAEMVKQLLTFGRGVEGQRVLLQPDHLIREIRKIVEGTFPKSIRVRSNREGDSWPVVGDPTQLHQVLLNLCVNARDAMPQGGTLTCKTENVTLDQQYAAMAPEAKAGPYVIIRVADTGTGIPKVVLDRIFEPFFTTKELGIGTGLGLSTVLGIIKSHGGFIKVDTEMGRGTEFAVYLPAAPGRSLQADKDDSSPVPKGNGELVLVVDDEAVITETCRKSLEKHGYRVVIANDGVEALTIYARQAAQISAVISDLEMPFLDGVGLVRAIKRMQPEARILIATAIDGSDARNDKVAQLREIGVTSFLTKPFNSNTLLLALHHQFHP